MRGLIWLAIPVLAACAAQSAEGAARSAGADRDSSDPKAAADAPGEDTQALYRDRIMGRWGETADCGGWVWDFKDSSLTGPGGMDAPAGITCGWLRVSDGPGGAVRIFASSCTRGTMLHGEVVMDATRDGDTLTLDGVFEPVEPAQWKRCEQ